MSEVLPTRCPSTRLTGEHCTLDAGHAGSHIQVSDNLVTAWFSGYSANGLPKQLKNTVLMTKERAND